MDDSALELYRTVEKNLKEQKDLDSTIAILDSLLADKIDEVSALYLLGSVYVLKTHFAIAEKLFLQADKLKPNNEAIVNGLGCVAMELLRHDEAIALFKKSLEIKKDPMIYNNLATCNVHLGNLEEGLKWARMAVEGMPNDPEAQQNLAQCLLGLGKWQEGFSYYDSRLLLPDRKEKFYTANKSDKYWNGNKEVLLLGCYSNEDEPLKTRKTNLVVHGEQGLGDELMFASMLPDVIKDCNVIYDCNSRLLNIMRDSFPDITIYGTKQQNGNVEWAANHQIDAKISIGSLAKFYRNDDRDFPKVPYLKADPKLIEKYRKKLAELGSKPKIGISWYGGAKRTSQSYRFNPLANWLDILKLDCDFISLQYNEEAGGKIERFNKDNGTNIIHWPDMVADYDETAALLMNLNLVVSAPQSVVHLAGGLGVPCWRLCARQAMWLHGQQGKDAPWYGSVKNYWQEDNGDWKPVMDKVYKDLKNDFC